MRPTSPEYSLAPLGAAEIEALRARFGGVTGSPDPIEDIYPLSPVQEAMLFQTLASDADDLYLVQQTLEIDGPLDLDAFGEAWHHVVRLHPALRTCFAWRHDGPPVQVVLRDVSIEIESIDLDGSDDPAQAIEDRARSDRAHRFGLDVPPLMRLAVFRLGDGRHSLLWSQHHLIEDGWSATAVLSQVFAAYESLRRGIVPEIDVSRPYRDHIAWLGDRDRTAEAEFWRSHLAGLDEPTLITTEPDDERSYLRTSLTLERPASDAVRALARDARVTLNTVLVGALAVTLGRYLDRDDVVFGVVASGRQSSLPEAPEMVGMFINTLPLRLTLDDEQPVQDWLAAVQSRQSAVMEHEHTSLGEIQGWSGLGAATPLTDTLFAYWNFDASGASGGEVTYRTVSGYGHTGFPFSITIEGSDPLRIALDIDGDGFDETDAGRFLDHYAQVLGAMAADPAQQLGNIEMLSPAELEALDAFNDTASEIPHATLLEAFAAQAQAQPDAVAIAAGAEQLTYAELDAASDAVAGMVAQRTFGGRVAVYMRRSPHLVAAILGVLKAGAAYVPVDPEYPPDRVSFVLEDAAAELVLTDAGLGDDVPQTAAETLVLPLETAAVGDAPYVYVDDRTLAYVMYTSGSTGRPKGVMVTHGNLVNYVWWAATTYGDGSPVSMPLYSSIGFDLTVTSLFVPLVTGGTVVVYPEREPGHLDVADVFADDAVDVVKLTPSHLGALDASAFAVERIRSLIVGGEELPARLAADVVAASQNRLTIFNEYGPTEATVGCMIHRFDPAVDVAGGVSIGRPAGNARIHVLDHALRPTPEDVPGEICIAGAGVAAGYLNRPELTAERFVAEPGTGEPMYRSGDVGRRGGAGDLEFLGRNDDQVKVRGHRIELGEIEAVLEAHPAVAQAAVALREPQPGDVRLVAYHTMQPGATATVTELRTHLRTALPEYMVVQNFVPLVEMPLSRHGKLDRSALPQTIGDTAISTAYVAPSTPAERLVTDAAARLLGVDRVSVTDNFFELGGHSLSSLRLITELHAATGKRISPRVILLNTLQQAAALLPDVAPPVGAEMQQTEVVESSAEHTPAASASSHADAIGTSAYFFGDAASPLFGLHSFPEGGSADGGVLLCPPVGWAYMRTHWALRKLARMLARSGLHVLRFDFTGTGDSAGDGSEAEWERWLEDVVTAADELREAAATDRISLVGTRLGATLAAAAAQRIGAIERLVMWDPVVSGANHLATLRAMNDETLRTRKRPYLPGDVGDELLGVPYPPQLCTALQSIDLRELPALDTEGTLIVSSASAEYAGLAAAHDSWLRYEVVNDVGGWEDVASSYSALLPAAIPSRIVKLIGGGA